MTSASTPSRSPKTSGTTVSRTSRTIVAVAQVVLAAGHDHRHERHRAVRGGLGLGRAAQAVDREQPLLQRLDGGLRRRLVRPRDDDLEGQRRALRPLLVEQVHALDGIDGVRERGEVALAQVQPERRDGHRQQQRRRPATKAITGRRMTARTTTAHMPLPSGRSRPRNGIAQPVDAVAEDGQRRRQERERADDRDQHHRDRPDGHRLEEDVVEQEQPGDREHDRQPEKNTARPAVAEATRMASCLARPWRRSVR